MLDIKKSLSRHACGKVAPEIEHSEKEGVTENASGPTKWVSWIVLLPPSPPKPKSPGEIQTSVDLRDANRAILRTRKITPTIEELNTDVYGTTMFSKQDLHSTYRQLTVHPSSR